MAILVFGFGIAIPCLFNKFTGLYCPGCGITRAGLAFIHGDFYQAIRYNMIIFLDIPLIILGTIIQYKYKKNEKLTKAINIMYVILVIITILFGVLRNMPMFSFLAPTQI